MSLVLKADTSADNAWAYIDLGSNQDDLWISVRVAFHEDTFAFWASDSLYLSDFLVLYDDEFGQIDQFAVYAFEAAWNSTAFPPPMSEAWQTVEVHYAGGTLDFYVDDVLSFTQALSPSEVRYVLIGQLFGETFDPLGVMFLDDVKVGTTRGGTELFADDFEGGDLSAWTDTYGDLTVTADPFDASGFPRVAFPKGACVAFDSDALDVSPVWRRLG
jgi:hypothetical protein